ncbi:MAG: hypothetical protein ACOC6P_04395, partial [Candidatus Aminicenantaceae bacterium]
MNKPSHNKSDHTLEKNDQPTEKNKSGKKRIGVFVCHCGINIAGTVNVKKTTEELSKHEGVVFSEDYVYM